MRFSSHASSILCPIYSFPIQMVCNESTVGGRFGYNPRASTSSVYGNIMGNASYNLMQHMSTNFNLLRSISIVSILGYNSEKVTKDMFLIISTIYFIKHYNEVATAHGRIDLKIDDWADAAAKRE